MKSMPKRTAVFPASGTALVAGAAGKGYLASLLETLLEAGGGSVVAGRFRESYARPAQFAGDGELRRVVEGVSLEQPESIPDMLVLLGREPAPHWAAECGIVVRAAASGESQRLELDPGLYTYSLMEPVWRGAYVRHGLVVCVDAGKAHVLGSLRSLRIPGSGLVDAVLAAVSAALAAGVEPSAIRTALYGFPGPRHRLEHLGQVRGVHGWNDASSRDGRDLAFALDAFDQDVTLITGGRSFSAGFELLEAVRARVGRIVLLPGTPKWVVETWGLFVDARQANDLAQAVSIARDLTVAGGAILFSPGCSLGLSYAEVELRGRLFVERFLAP